MTPPAGRPRHPDVLTPAEWRVLDHLREGRANAEIAVRLGVSVNTVRSHVSSMLAKLELPDRHALAAWNGQPRRRFGWLPAWPSVALGFDGAGRIAAVTGGVAVAILVVAIALARNADPEPLTTVVAYTDEGLIGLDHATGAPLLGLTPFDPYDNRGLSQFDMHKNGLIWAAQDEHEEGTYVVAIDGARIGLRSSGFPADADGLVRRWNLPPPDRAVFVSSRVLALSIDGETAYVSRSATGDFDRASGLTRHHDLWRIDLHSDQPHLMTTSFEIGDIHAGVNGRLFLEAFNSNELIEVDPADGQEIRRVTFTFPLNFSSTHLAQDHRRLYVFDAGETTLSVVDLDRFEVVEELKLPEGTPSTYGAPWDRAWSPSERRLYLAGDDLAECDEENANLDVNGLRNCHPQPIGVWAIDLTTAEVLYEDPEHNRLALSPDGRWLITTLWTRERNGLSTRPPRGDGLKVIDTSTFEVVAHLEVGELTFVPGTSGDGRYAYALQQGPTKPWERGWEECTAECTTLLVVDLEMFEVIARRPYDEDWYANFLHVVP